MQTLLVIIKQDEVAKPILVELDVEAENIDDVYVEDQNKIIRLIQTKFQNTFVMGIYILDGLRRFRIEEALTEVGG